MRLRGSRCISPSTWVEPWDVEEAGMAAVLVYVEAFPEREVVQYIEGEEIELPPEKEEEIPSVLEGAETKEESPLAPEGVLMFFIFLRHWFHEGSLIYQVWSKMT
jgi:hypothetical protein